MEGIDFQSIKALKKKSTFCKGSIIDRKSGWLTLYQPFFHYNIRYYNPKHVDQLNSADL